MNGNPFQFAIEQTARGAVGGATTFLAVVAPWQERVDWYIDTAGRLVGIGIGLAVFASIVVGIFDYIRRRSGH